MNNLNNSSFKDGKNESSFGNYSINLIFCWTNYIKKLLLRRDANKLTTNLEWKEGYSNIQHYIAMWTP